MTGWEWLRGKIGIFGVVFMMVVVLPLAASYVWVRPSPDRVFGAAVIILFGMVSVRMRELRDVREKKALAVVEHLRSAFSGEQRVELSPEQLEDLKRGIR